jgi:20S proteasome alpha/beta subunit
MIETFRRAIYFKMIIARFSLWFYAGLLALLLTSVSSSSNNYNVYNYDMTTPQFTPDGRLLQVEYASAAADLSSPLVALQMKNDTLILITVKKSNTQNRMALLQDNSACVAMSGVLADSVALIQTVLEESSKNFQRYKKALTILQIANVIANACQRHSFGGGIRPYGSTMLVCGFLNSKSVIYQTDPSGAIIEVSPVEAGKQVRWLVGGNESLQRQLRKRIDQALDRQRSNETSIADVVSLVAQILVKESQRQHKGMKRAPSKESNSLEIVILSPVLGCHRLTEDQLGAIFQKA